MLPLKEINPNQLKRELPLSSDSQDDDAAPARKRATKSNKSFERGFASLKAFREEHGHTHIPYRVVENRSLGSWVARTRKSKDELSAEQIQRLEALGFSFEAVQDRTWNTKFARLKAYQAKYGNTLVPTCYKEDIELGEWVAKQRQKYKQGRLSEERQKKLNTLSFVYRINKFIQRKATPREDKKWFAQMSKLLMFSLEWGHTLVPFMYSADKSLGRWVNEQRCQSMRGLLRDERKDALDCIGFVWKVNGRDEEADSPTVLFDVMFRRLVEYRVVHGNYDIFSTDKESTHMQTWASQQKELMRSGQLEATKALRLAAIGFCNDGNDKIFNRNIQKLKVFCQEKGHCDMIALEDPGFALWIVIQRYLSKKGILNSDRKQRLVAMGFEFDTTPLDLPMPESRYVSRESSIAQVKATKANEKRSRAGPKRSKKERAAAETVDDSTVSSDGNNNSDTTAHTSFDISVDGAPDEDAKKRQKTDGDGLMGLLAIALNWKP